MKERPKFKGFDYEDGRIVKVAYFDGKDIGDRILEEVMFKVEVQDDGTLNVSVVPSSAEYFSTLNEQKWLKAALEFAEGNDVFCETEKGGEDLCLLPA